MTNPNSLGHPTRSATRSNSGPDLDESDRGDLGVSEDVVADEGRLELVLYVVSLGESLALDDQSREREDVGKAVAVVVTAPSHEEGLGQERGAVRVCADAVKEGPDGAVTLAGEMPSPATKPFGNSMARPPEQPGA